MCQLLLGSLLFGQAPYDLHTQNEDSYGIRIDWSIDPSVEPTAYNIYKDGEYHHTILPQWNGLFTSYIYSTSSCDNFDNEYCFTVTALYGEEESDHSNETCGAFVDDEKYNCLIVDETDIYLEESSLLEISFTNLLSITGFQFNLVIDPLIVSIDSVIATDRLDGFGIAFNQYEDGRIFIIGYSLTGAEVDPGEGPIVDVYFTGDTLGFAEVCIDDGILATSNGSQPISPLTSCGSLNVIEECNSMLGDVNLDGAINILDIVHLVNHILGGTLLDGCGLELADVNGDGIINILDVIQLISFPILP